MLTLIDNSSSKTIKIDMGGEKVEIDLSTFMLIMEDGIAGLQRKANDESLSEESREDCSVAAMIGKLISKRAAKLLK